jgi:hypothetical protein
VQWKKQRNYFENYFFHLAAAALRAFSRRCSGVRLASFFLPSASPKLGRFFAAADFAGLDTLPPLRPITAAALLMSSVILLFPFVW